MNLLNVNSFNSHSNIMEYNINSIGDTVVKNPPAYDPWVGKIPWSRKWQPTPVFLPGKFHGRRSLVGSMRVVHEGHSDLDMTE